MNIKVFSIAMFIAFWACFLVRNYSSDLQKEILLTMLIFHTTYYASKEFYEHYIVKRNIKDEKVERKNCKD